MLWVSERSRCELPLNILDDNKSALVFVDAVQQITFKKKKKIIVQVRLQQLLCHLPQRNTLNMAWTSNSYKYVQSLMSGVDSSVHSSVLPSVLWSVSITLKKQEWKSENAWRRVCSCVFLSECVNMCGTCLWVFACVLLPVAMCVQYELHWRWFGRRCSLMFLSYRCSPWGQKEKKKTLKWHFLFVGSISNFHKKMSNIRTHHYQNIHKPQTE